MSLRSEALQRKGKSCADAAARATDPIVREAFAEAAQWFYGRIPEADRDFGKREYVVARQVDGSRLRARLRGPGSAGEFDGQIVEAYSEEEAIAVVSRQRQMGGESPVRTADSLTLMFYLLLRDHIHPGDIEQVVLNLEGEEGCGPSVLSNRYLAGYAENLADRLRGLG